MTVRKIKTIGVILVFVGLGSMALGPIRCNRNVPEPAPGTDTEGGAGFVRAENFVYWMLGGGVVTLAGACLCDWKKKDGDNQ